MQKDLCKMLPKPWHVAVYLLSTRQDAVIPRNRKLGIVKTFITS